MKFVLFRHAHKGNLPYDDPELSQQGFDQAALILELIKKNSLPEPTDLFVSPKRRTSQTFYSVSKEFQIPNKINPDLDQQNMQENRIEFRKRISRFLQQIQSPEQPDSVLYACTHYDWIEESMTLINCDKDLNSFEFSHWSPAQYVIFELKDRVWKFFKKGTVK